jgi:PAS domain S-box-containing protein
MEAIQREFEMRVAGLETLAKLCSTRNGFTADEFRDFAAKMQRDSAMKSVTWIPRTSTAGGIEQFRIAFAEPLSGNEALLGQDVGSSNKWHETLETARDIDATMSIPVTRLAKEDREKSEFLLLLPVYRNGAPHETIMERRANLAGFVAGSFGVNELVTAAFKPLVPAGIDTFVYSQFGSDPDGLLHHHIARQAIRAGGRWSIAPANFEAASFEFILVGQRPRSVLCRTTPAWAESVPQSESGWILLSGILLSGVGAILAYRSSQRRRTIERLVKERTAELAGANRGLQTENTARKQAEVLLMESRERLALAKESAHIGIWDWDVVADRMVWDTQMYELYGIREQDFSGAVDAWKNGLHPDDRDRAEAENAAALGGTKEFVTEFRVVWPNGEVRHIEAHGLVQRAGDGSATRMIGVNWDVTARRQADDELKASLKEVNDFRAAVDEHAIVAITDPRGRITFVNDKFCAISKYSREELIGQDHRIINSGHHSQEFIRDLWTTIAHGRVWQGEMKNRARDGSFYWVNTTIVPFLDAQGKPRQYVAIRADITELKQAEAELRQATDAAETANRAKSEFLANMSHEIRTPMNGILGMTELVLETELDAEQRRYLGMAKSSADALLHLINEILDFSKIEAGKLELEAIGFNLRESIAHMFKPLVFRAGQKRIELVTNIAPEIPERLVGDPLRLRQILMNFTDNALKFTERGSITVNVASEAQSDGEQCLHFSVIDTGIGIPAEKQAVIFEAFAQVDGSTTRSYGGTGLGLAIASQLIEQMRGKVWIESTVGEGTTFHFTAWFGVDRVARIPEVAGRAVSVSEVARPDSGLRILLVEDNVINTAVATGILKRRGHSVTHAINGCDAVAAAATGAFDIIFMDVQMPEIDGFEATRRIREMELGNGDQHTPIVAMTAHALTGDRERCLAAGMDDYISKPFEKSELLTLLARIAASPQDAPTLTQLAS